MRPDLETGDGGVDTPAGGLADEFNPDRLPGPTDARAKKLEELDIAAGVTISVGGGECDSKALLAEGRIGDVIGAFFEHPREDADGLNNHGCALALAHEWDDALARLAKSREAAPEDASPTAETRTPRARAEHNIEVVKAARARS